jgi:hypothetical protein
MPSAPVGLRIHQAGRHRDKCIYIFSFSRSYVEAENTIIQRGLQHHLSPLTSRSLIVFLARWAQTYLLIDAAEYSQCSPALVAKYGKDGKGI